METHEKIRRWLKENRVTQVDLAALTKNRVPQTKISSIINQSQPATARYIVPLAKAMGLSLDWLYDDDLSWPPPEKGEAAVTLTAAQRQILDLARIVSEGDEELTIARRRLLGFSETQPAANIPPGTSVAPDSHKAEERNGTRTRKGRTG